MKYIYNDGSTIIEGEDMPGTKIGGLKAKEANIKRDPDHYRKIGAIGGRSSSGKTNGGFNVATPEQRAAWGKIGGKKSRRGKVKIPVSEV